MTQTERYVDGQQVSGQVQGWGLVCTCGCTVNDQRYNKGDMLQSEFGGSLFYRTRLAALLARNAIDQAAPFDAVLLTG